MKVRILMVMVLLACGVMAVTGLKAEDSDEDLQFYKSGDYERGRNQFMRHGCVQCHLVSSDPDLPESPAQAEKLVLGYRDSTESSDEIARAILDPRHREKAHLRKGEVTEPQLMDEQGNHVLSGQDLIDLVTYLRSQE